MTRPAPANRAVSNVIFLLLWSGAAVLALFTHRHQPAWIWIVLLVPVLIGTTIQWLKRETRPAMESGIRAQFTDPVRAERAVRLRLAVMDYMAPFTVLLTAYTFASPEGWIRLFFAALPAILIGGLGIGIIGGVAAVLFVLWHKGRHP